MSNQCRAPWVSRVIHANGTATPCCYTDATNIFKLKQAFIAGIKPVECSHCWHTEALGLPSPRFGFSDNPATSVTSLTINLGNYCNAECIMCNGYTSSSRNTWAKRYDAAQYYSETIQSIVADLDFTEYPELDSVTLLGGEPTLHPDTIPLLDQMIATGLAANITISFNTNSSHIDEKLISRLVQFRDIFVTLSIDGAGEQFEYQRRPLKWDTVKQVADQWMMLSKNIVINYVLTVVSIWGFNEFIEWYENLSQEIKDKQPQILITHVSADVTHLTLNNMPPEQREYWIEQAVDHTAKDEILNILDLIDYAPCEHFNKKIAVEDVAAKKKFVEIIPYDKT